MKKETHDWEKEFKRLRFNPIYFIEQYYNKMHPESKVELSKEEKQRLFNEYKGTPHFNSWDKMMDYQNEVDKLKAEGYEDWEIF